MACLFARATRGPRVNAASRRREGGLGENVALVGRAQLRQCHSVSER